MPPVSRSGLKTGGTSATEEGPGAPGSHQPAGPKWDHWGLSPATHWHRGMGAVERPEEPVASQREDVATDQEGRAGPKWGQGAVAAAAG